MMFNKSLKIIKKDITVVEYKIMIISTKLHMFLPGDQLILFNSYQLKGHFSVPKNSIAFLDELLVGTVGASGTMDIKSDHFTGILHALYICS